MNEKERNQRVWELWDAGQKDPQYCALLEEMSPLSADTSNCCRPFPVSSRM